MRVRAYNRKTKAERNMQRRRRRDLGGEKIDLFGPEPFFLEPFTYGESKKEPGALVRIWKRITKGRGRRGNVV